MPKPLRGDTREGYNPALAHRLTLHCASLSSLRDLGLGGEPTTGLTPWATLCRPYGTISCQGRYAQDEGRSCPYALISPMYTQGRTNTALSRLGARNTSVLARLSRVRAYTRQAE